MTACERSRRFPAPRRWEVPNECPGFDPRRVARPTINPMAPVKTLQPCFDGEPGDHWQLGHAGA